MADFIRETRMLELLPDEEIRQKLSEKLQEPSGPPERMVLTWRKEKLEYLLEIVMAGTAEESAQRLVVGRVHVNDCDALNRLAIAGRRLYFRLREEFPALQRKLSRYQYFTEK